MHISAGSTLATVAVAIFAFRASVAAQAIPEITAPGMPPMSDNQTWMITPPLTPDDEDYIDESDYARLMKRAPPAGSYICDGTNWGGKCKWTPMTDYQCLDYPANAASSFGAPQGWQCKIFYSKGCTPGTGTDGKLTYPGTPNLGATYNRKDKPGSYMCRMCNTASGDHPWLENPYTLYTDDDVFFGSVNNNAPDFYFAQVKYGYGGDGGTCTSWDANIGTTKKYTCLPQATVDPHFV
ncbi:hypothetical protein A1O7_08418 [Cladophialophora yegresii CBS 114405]|uniref:Ig-like domain-containing protein n=1 Tax=Cladophialophora yegresii CBS 114405 TaxID=1182544 RepID=W9VTK1_9EURO|nr:uncharacterized protein A1O7_08418 [Cladophialophora yegresii CBS 114405]EXJ55491.1 hypothetical protein A1O7_08418 [Cladophialophora yegresii CBS 114405]